MEGDVRGGLVPGGTPRTAIEWAEWYEQRRQKEAQELEDLRPPSPSMHSNDSYTEQHDEFTFTVRVVCKHDQLSNLEQDFEARDQPEGFRMGGLPTTGIRDTLGGLRGKVVSWLQESLPELKAGQKVMTKENLRFYCDDDFSDLSQELQDDYLPLRDLAHVIRRLRRSPQGTEQQAEPVTLFVTIVRPEDISGTTG